VTDIFSITAAGVFDAVPITIFISYFIVWLNGCAKAFAAFKTEVVVHNILLSSLFISLSTASSLLPLYLLSLGVSTLCVPVLTFLVLRRFCTFLLANKTSSLVYGRLVTHPRVKKIRAVNINSITSYVSKDAYPLSVD